MTRSTTIIVFFLLIPLLANAQSWQLVKETPLDAEVIHSSIDRNGNIYLADSRGNIRQHDKDGELLNLYSTKLIGQIYLLESWHGLRTFAFYQDLQESLITDRFLANERRYQLSPQTYIRLVTMSQDLNLWTLSEDNLIIRKINLFDNSVIIENQWNSDYSNDDLDITYIKEYKNRLYFLDRATRILVFDNLGNPISTIDSPDVKSVSFSGDYLIANSGKSIQKVNINSLETETISLPESADHVYIIDATYYLINSDRLIKYTYNPL